jgi:very-short-patch-repair endonuclease
MVANSLIDGIRLDMDFPELKLNFELDGPTHRYPSRARFDRERDEYLSVKKGYKVRSPPSPRQQRHTHPLSLSLPVSL